MFYETSVLMSVTRILCQISPSVEGVQELRPPHHASVELEYLSRELLFHVS